MPNFEVVLHSGWEGETATAATIGVEADTPQQALEVVREQLRNAPGGRYWEHFFPKAYLQIMGDDVLPTVSVWDRVRPPARSQVFVEHAEYYVTEFGTSRSAPLNMFTNLCLPVGMEPTQVNLYDWGETWAELKSKFCTLDRVPHQWYPGRKDASTPVEAARGMVRKGAAE